MKNKKMIASIGAVVFGLLIAAISFVYFNSQDRYADNWNVTLPSDKTKLYSVDSVEGLQSDGEYFEVYKLENVDSTFLNEFSLESNKLLETKTNNGMDKLKVEQQYRPDFGGGYSWKVMNKEKSGEYTDPSSLTMIYSSTKKQLYIYEELF